MRLYIGMSLQKFRKVLKDLKAHCLTLDIAYLIVKHTRDFIKSHFSVNLIVVIDLKWLYKLEILLKEVLEEVRTIIMLEVYKSFLYFWTESMCNRITTTGLCTKLNKPRAF